MLFLFAFMVRPPSMDEAEKERQPACKPGSVWPGFCPDATAIPLGRPSPGASSNQPERQGLRTGPRGEPARRSYSVLLPAGLAVPPTLPPARCALTAPFHPYPAGPYPAPRPYGARTFLRFEKSGGRPADWRKRAYERRAAAVKGKREGSPAAGGGSTRAGLCSMRRASTENSAP